MHNLIYLWSDVREKSLHQKYIVNDYIVSLNELGYEVMVNQTRHWDDIYNAIREHKPVLFLLHGGKVFDIETLRKIHKICKVYLRWRWNPDPPMVLLDNCDIASKVSFVKNNYNGKLFYSPHPAIMEYFYPQIVTDVKYHSKIFFVGLAGERGKGFYKRSGRNAILKSKYVRYLNQEMFGTGNKGFYDYDEISKYYNCAHMALNVSSFDNEINFRVFNAMACKTIVISDRTPAMDQYFTPDVDYIMYNKKTLIDFEFKVKTFCGNTDVIANRAYDKILKYHTSTIRLDEMIRRVI